MADITDAVAYAFAKNYSGSGNWLNEGTGGSAHDGTISGATWTDAGDSSYFTFDGVNDQIYLADHANLDFAAGEDFTIGAAAYSSDWANSNYHGLISKRDGSGFGYILFANNDSANYDIAFKDTGSSSLADRIASPSDGVAATLIMRRKTAGTDEGEVFKDGTGTGSPGNGASGTLANAEAFRLGCADAGSLWWAGRIYSYAVIRQALTDAEIVALHGNLINQTTTQPPLSGYWGLRVAMWRMGLMMFNERPTRPEGIRERLWLPEGCLA